MKEKPTVGSPFLGAFPSENIPKATKDANVHFFIHGYLQEWPHNYTSDSWEGFEASTFYEQEWLQT